ncbi:C40 family peptidase (plasmid) [Clostridium baratii]
MFFSDDEMPGGNNSALIGAPAEYIEYFNEGAKIFNIPNWIFAAVAKQESDFNPNCVSPDGAFGIMQFQRQDIGAGGDLWAGAMKEGLEKVYKDNGYKFETYQEMWVIFLKDVKAQVIAGGFELRRYANYVLYNKKIVDKLDYNSNENMKLIKWNSDEKDEEFREILRRIFACYNGGPSYGVNVDLDAAQNNYPNQVFQYAMEFRKNGINGSGQKGDNETIEKAIDAGVKLVGKSPYVWGGGRTEEDVKAGRFDCSSFVHYCYASAGITLGDRSGVTTWTLLEQGKAVDSKDMKRGDLIFFDTTGQDTHVGLYLGDNKFIHDSTSKGVTISDLTNSYYKKAFNGKVRRIIN